MAAREFDLILYGATGFTGFRTCQYLARTYKNVRWGIAGRSIPKLEEVRNKLAAIDPALANLPLVKADASSQESLQDMTARTKVVISTVGPFIHYGVPLVEACVKQGTHYIDSTGEFSFVNTIIEKYHEEARTKNVILVPQCGFDSIPSEIGTKMVVDHLRKEYNLRTKSAKLSLTKINGVASGGTLASLCAVIETRGPLGEMMDQNQTVPKEVAPKIAPARVSFPTVHYDRDVKKWQTYFFMSSTNEKTVKRSHGLAMQGDGVGYGSQFSYRETMSTRGFFSALGMSLGVSIGSVALLIGPLRRFIQRKFLPPPGTGPSDEDIAKGYFTIKVFGESELPEVTEGEETPKPIKVVAVVEGGEPGYSETCRYLVESAMCIIQNEDRVRSENKITGGVLTPAFAFGQILVDRLRAQNVNLTVSKL
ncbi:Saccharopine dehydrogenase-domain-containing protein [Mortierella sp. GBAus27b]|nr:Saccharopine dehydrogenase-domain-containing protein [Mortierella sp. GBAus27b]